MPPPFFSTFTLFSTLLLLNSLTLSLSTMFFSKSTHPPFAHPGAPHVLEATEYMLWFYECAKQAEAQEEDLNDKQLHKKTRSTTAQQSTDRYDAREKKRVIGVLSSTLRKFKLRRRKAPKPRQPAWLEDHLQRLRSSK